jgi:hypothetical protein
LTVCQLTAISRTPAGAYPAAFQEADVRNLILSSILTIALFVVTAVTVLADSTGPGI